MITQQPKNSRYVVTMDGHLNWRVYDAVAGAWADRKEDANPTRDGAMARALAMDALSKSGVIEKHAWTYVYDDCHDEPYGPVPPEQCWFCQNHLHDAEPVVDIAVDASTTDYYAAPELVMALFHPRCFVAYAGRSGMSPTTADALMQASTDGRVYEEGSEAAPTEALGAQ